MGIETYRVERGTYPALLSDVKLAGALREHLEALQAPDIFKKVYYDPANPVRRIIPGTHVALITVYCLALLFELGLYSGWKTPPRARKAFRFACSSLLAAGAIYVWPFWQSGIDYIMPRTVPNPDWQDKPQSIDYCSDGKEFWVLRSLGPDGDADVADLAAMDTTSRQGDVGSSWIPFIYDPTNGVISGGDILRFRN
jgi:hypothetical protein